LPVLHEINLQILFIPSGIVSRKAYEVVPPDDEYKITGEGEKQLPIMWTISYY
jgi:DNA-binding HxlR family transcriptional regulator